MSWEITETSWKQAEKLGAAGTFLNKDEEEKKKASDLFDRKSDICIRYDWIKSDNHAVSGLY